MTIHFTRAELCEILKFHAENILPHHVVVSADVCLDDDGTIVASVDAMLDEEQNGVA